MSTSHTTVSRSALIEAEKSYSFRDTTKWVSKPETITGEVSKIRQQIRTKLDETESDAQVGDLATRLQKVELENKQLRTLLDSLSGRLAKLEGGKAPVAAAPAKPEPAKPAAAPAKAEKKDDDFDLFDDDDEDEEEKERIKAERVKAYADKKAKKPVLIAKSSILLDVKPWDDETDMKALEESVRSIVMEGLVWGSSKLVPVAYSVKKLQIQCVVEDDKVSTEVLEEKICEFDDYVQSVDIAAFNKI